MHTPLIWPTDVVIRYTDQCKLPSRATPSRAPWGPKGPLGAPWAPWDPNPGQREDVNFKTFPKICIFGIFLVQYDICWVQNGKSGPAGGRKFQKLHQNWHFWHFWGPKWWFWDQKWRFQARFLVMGRCLRQTPPQKSDFWDFQAR